MKRRMNYSMWESKKKPTNLKPLYWGVAFAVVVIFTGGGLDSSHIFGDGSTLLIQVTVSVLAGLIIGVTWISANTGVKVKELIC